MGVYRDFTPSLRTWRPGPAVRTDLHFVSDCPPPGNRRGAPLGTWSAVVQFTEHLLEARADEGGPQASLMEPDGDRPLSFRFKPGVGLGVCASCTRNTGPTRSGKDPPATVQRKGRGSGAPKGPGGEATEWRGTRGSGPRVTLSPNPRRRASCRAGIRTLDDNDIVYCRKQM